MSCAHGVSECTHAMPSVLETDAPPNSDIEEKRLQRRMVERHIQAALLKNHAQNGSYLWL